MRKVICLGEMLIDFIGKDQKSLIDNENFEKKAGGAPANVCASICRLGGESMFLGQVGKDQFGEYLCNILKQEKVDTTGLVKEGQTTLAFVSLDKDGERDFEFFKGSDQEYTIRKDILNVIHKDSIVHFGSATAFLNNTLNTSYNQLLEKCKKEGAFISFDPNYRDALIDTKEKENHFIKESLRYIAKSHLVKVSEEELLILTNIKKREKAVQHLHKLGAQVVCVTLGKVGTLLSVQGMIQVIPSIPIQQIDSTGAGDAFVGAMLYQLSLESSILDSSLLDYRNMVIFANKVGAYTCTKYGAIDALPALNDLQG